jgi:hypothetical protein
LNKIKVNKYHRKIHLYEAGKLVSDAIIDLPPANVDLLVQKPLIFSCVYELKAADT